MTVLSTLYGAMLLSSIFLPPLLIRMLGCKWTVVLSMSCYVTFSLGNFYASWYSPQLAAPGTRAQGGLATRDPQRAHAFPRHLPAHCLRFKMSSASRHPLSASGSGQLGGSVPSTGTLPPADPS